MTELGANPEQQPYLPVHQPAFVAPRGRWHRPALIGALLCAVAAVLAVVGSLVPLFVGEIRAPGGIGFTMTVTGWDFRIDALGTSGSTFRNGAVPSNGAPLVLGAVVLLAAALLGLIAATQPFNASSRRLAGVVAVAAAAFLAGTVLTVGMQVISWFDSFGPIGSLANAQNTSTDLTVGAGFWLLVLAAVAAVVAAVFVWLAPRAVEAPVVTQVPETQVP